MHAEFSLQKPWILKKMGKDKKPNKAQTITDEEVDTLYRSMLATIPLTVFGSYSDPSLWRTFIIYLHIMVLSSLSGIWHISCQSQTHDDFVIAQVLQEELQHAQYPETECLQADIIPGPTNDNDKENFPTNHSDPSL
jgi:hypothetical protein